MSPETVRVQFSDDALATIAAHLAQQVPGVLALQPPLSGRLRSGLRAGVGRRPRTPDAAGVEIHRADGAVEVSLRIGTALHPAPLVTARAVADAVRAGLEPLLGSPVTVVVTIVAVSG